jgi:hypothetical protein
MKKFLTYAAIAAIAGSCLTSEVSAAQGDATFQTVTGNVTTNTRWTRDKVYILTRMIFVTNNAVLTIEPGTIIRGIRKGLTGPSGLANEPGALIVSRTGKLVANGTPDAPIILTSIDDYNVPGGLETVPASFVNSQGTTITVAAPGTSYDANGLTAFNGFGWAERWGGVVMLGRAHVGQNSGSTDTSPADGISDTVGASFNDDGLANNAAGFIGADVIEGIFASFVTNTSGPGTDKLGVYGGVNMDNDNSGVLRFVSIRYAGDVIGASNELNSLTMGGVGDSTVFEHIECTFNTDDGFEWFGGKNNSRFLYSLYNRDDAFDADEGWRTTAQFWTAMQGADTIARSNYASNNTTVGQSLNSTGGNNVNFLMEIDGSEPDNAGHLPVTNLAVYNFSFFSAGALGGGGEHAIRFRLTSVGNLFNGVCELLPGALTTPLSGAATPYTLNITNVHHQDIFTVATGGAANQFNAATGTVSEATSQVIGKNPYNRYDGTSNLGYDIRLASGAGARTDDGTLPPSGFIQVNYAGSARDNTGLQGWSHLNSLGVLPSAGNHPTRLSVSLGLSSSNPTVSFVFSGRGAGTVDYPSATKFVVERSLDGRTWTPVTVVTDGAGADTNATTGAITVTDTGATAGTTPVLYRAFAL